MVRLYFPDAVVLEGDDAADVLRRWGALQWSPIKDMATIRVAISERAWVWSSFTLDPLLPADEFLTALDASGLCAVVWDGTPAKPREPRT